MSAVEQCLESLANTALTTTNSLNTVSESISGLIAITDTLRKRIEELEARVKELENPNGGSGAGHYGGGPWG